MRYSILFIFYFTVFFRIFGTRCSKCCHLITQNDWIRRAGEQVSDSPVTFSKGPAIFCKRPVTLSKGPAIFCKRPVTLSKGPVVFCKRPVTLCKGPVIFSKGPVIFS